MSRAGAVLRAVLTVPMRLCGRTRMGNASSQHAPRADGPSLSLGESGQSPSAPPTPTQIWANVWLQGTHTREPGVECKACTDAIEAWKAAVARNEMPLL